jgi:hypothetical protein
MIEKAWTPEACPLQVGSVVHNNYNNTDYAILARRLHGDLPTEAIFGIVYDNDGHIHWLSGEVLANGAWGYYPNWPDTSVTAPCYYEAEEPGMSDTEFIQAVFDTAKKLPGASKLFTISDRGLSTWDDDVYAVIQGNALSILEELKKCVEEKA